MDEKIVFATKNKLGCCTGHSLTFANCHYLEKYKKNRETIEKKNAWKTAPRSWELMKRGKDGSIMCLKKGVIDFDITSGNEIIYSNGKYLIRIDTEGNEQVIDTIDLVGRVKVYKR